MIDLLEELLLTATNEGCIINAAFQLFEDDMPSVKLHDIDGKDLWFVES